MSEMALTSAGADIQGGGVEKRLPPADAGGDFHSWWMVLVLFAFLMIAYVDRTILAHLVDPIAKSLVLSDFEMGLILGPAFAFAFSLAALPAGWAVDRFDRRFVVGAAMMFWSLMTIMCAFAANAFWLAAARMMVAAGEAFLIPAAYALIADRFRPHQLNSAFAAFNMGNKAGISFAFFAAAGAMVVAGGIQASFAPADHFEIWQIILFLVGLPGLLLAFLPLSFPKPRHRPQVARKDRPALWPFLRASRHFLLPFFAGAICVAVVNGAITAWLPTFMQRNFNWSTVEYGPWIGTLTAIGALLTVPQGILVDRLFRGGRQDAPLRYLGWMTALAAPLASIIFFLDDPTVFLVGLGIVFVLIMPYPVYIGTTIQLISPPELRGRMTGFLVAVVPIFSLGLGPLVVGFMTDFIFGDPKAIGLALGTICCVGIIASFVMLRLALKPYAALRRETDARRG